MSFFAFSNGGSVFVSTHNEYGRAGSGDVVPVHTSSIGGSGAGVEISSHNPLTLTFKTPIGYLPAICASNAAMRAVSCANEAALITGVGVASTSYHNSTSGLVGSRLETWTS